MSFGRLGALGRGFGRLGVVLGGAGTTPVPGVISAGAGAFNFTGSAATLRRTLLLSAGAGSFAFTGTAATLTKSTISKTLTAEAGSFLFSGDTMTPVVDYRLPADAGSFAFTGAAATLRATKLLSAAAGSFAFTGTAATLTKSGTPPTLTYIGTAASPSGGGTTTRTFTSVGIGTASANRRVIVIAPGSTDGRTINNGSSSINGVAFERSDIIGSNSDQGIVNISSAVVPSGTSGDIVINYSDDDFGLSRIYVFTVDDSLLLSSTPIMNFSDNTGFVTNTATTSVPTLAGGCLIGILRNSSGHTASITGGTSGLSTADDATNGYWVGHVNGASAATPSATITWTNNSPFVWGLAAYR